MVILKLSIQLCRKRRRESMKGAENNFVIKMGAAPESYNFKNKLLIYKGEQYPMVYDAENKCVGVVWEHDSHETQANGQAEICFYDSYFSEYGKWHRMFYSGHRGGKRIIFEKFLEELMELGEYPYIGYIVQK
jgi:hypothetical protein